MRDDKFKTCSVCRARIKLWRDTNLANGMCECGRPPVEKTKHCKTCYLKATCQQSLGDTRRYEELGNLFDKQQGYCPYSGKSLTLGVDTALDHKKAKSKGGSNHISNLQWTHKLVNQMKWDSNERDFIEMALLIAANCKSRNQSVES
jgi:hypothetical protein